MSHLQASDPCSRTIMSLPTKRLSLAQLLSGDSSGCFSIRSSHRPFCILCYVTYFKTILFCDYIVSSYSLEFPLEQSQGIKKIWQNISECVCALGAAPPQDHPSPLPWLNAASSCTTRVLQAHCEDTSWQNWTFYVQNIKCFSSCNKSHQLLFFSIIFIVVHRLFSYA